MKKTFIAFTLGMAIACSGMAGENAKRGSAKGGLIGSVIGAVLGHQEGKRTEGAGIGAVAGSLIGFAFGSGQDSRLKREIAQAELEIRRLQAKEKADRASMARIGSTISDDELEQLAERVRSKRKALAARQEEERAAIQRAATVASLREELSRLEYQLSEY